LTISRREQDLTSINLGRKAASMPEGALGAVFRSTELSGQGANTVIFSGGADPVLPTPFRIAAAGAAAIAATGLAAAELWREKTGQSQAVTVDIRQATAALRSGLYMQLGNGPAPDERNPIMGVYPTRDGRWAYIHANFTNHFTAALQVLGCEGKRAAVAQALADWNSLDFEEALIAAGGAGGMVRTPAEWAQHPQAIALVTLPLLDIERIGDSPPEPLPAGPRPLSGIRALDLTRLLAGPIAGRTLAEHGADVLKITAPHLPNLGYQEPDTSHGKLSASLDLRAPGDVETLLGLVRGADIFLQGYRPGALGARGFSPEELHALRPGLVYLSLSAFSHEGPWASRRGFDTVVQAMSGMAVIQAKVLSGSTAVPQFYPVSAIDYCTGYLLAAAAMVALKRRATEGGSWLVRISLAQVGKWIVDLGEAPASVLQGVPAEFAPDEIARWSTVTETPLGPLRHLKPVVQLSETPAFWARPAVPLGYHRPAWP
jgi:crotonobetainyl-CoA:carnitine CoA-transferase CaiB-like acyl-CoA transferase